MINNLFNDLLYNYFPFHDHLFLNNLLDLRVDFNRYFHRDKDFLVDYHLFFDDLFHLCLYLDWHFNWNEHFFHDAFFKYDRLVVELNWHLDRNEDLFFDYLLYDYYFLYFHWYLHQDFVGFVRSLACQSIIIFLLSLFVDLGVD